MKKNWNNTIENWITYHTDRNLHKDKFWAWEEVYYQIKNKDIETSWQIILELIKKSDSDRILANIAAGPLENFIRAKHKEVIERVEIQARRDPKFRRCLSGVWYENYLPKDTRDTIKKYTNTVKDPL